ncbi:MULTISPECIES: Mur ligase family protein [Pseudomonas]|uniref:Mur ligase family protein n=1 Tax=Pseudomonas TaxID=286 RepID=UPI00257A999A|nr:MULTISPECIES: Mur ligase family protein [Pseudomonas]
MNLLRSFRKIRARLLGQQALSRADVAREQALAHRRSLGETTFIGITGSGAKSTTAAFLHHLLSDRKRCALSLIYNTSEAIARRIQRLEARDEIAIFEISGHGPGAIDASAALVQPQLAIVTVISNDHYTNYRGTDATAQEKGKLVSHVFEAGGTAFLNADDPLVAKMAELAPGRAVRFGESPEADFRASDVRVSADGRLRFDCTHGAETAAFDIGLLGRHFIVSALAGIACAHHQGMSLTEIAERARSYVQMAGRCSIHRVAGGPTYLCDTIKSPLSTLGLAFSLMDAFPEAPRRTIVIGKISDYPGSTGRSYNRAYALARPHCERLVFFGAKPPSLKGAEEDERNGVILYAANHAELCALLSDAHAGEVILLKGSEKVDKLLLALPTTGESGIPPYHEALPAWDQLIREADYFTANRRVDKR